MNLWEKNNQDSYFFSFSSYDYRDSCKSFKIREDKNINRVIYQLMEKDKSKEILTIHHKNCHMLSNL